MNRLVRLLSVVLFLLAGCVPSLHPIYTKKDLIFEPALLGVWASGISKESWAFSAHEPKSYRLVYTDEKGRRGTFSAHLVKIGESTFLDFFPADFGGQQNEFYKYHFLRAHTFFLVHQIEPRLRVSSMRPDWLRKHLLDKPGAIRHEVVNGRVVLTAATAALQVFLLEQAKNRNAFGKPTDLARKKP